MEQQSLGDARGCGHATPDCRCASSTARTSWCRGNGFCRHTTLENSGDAGRKSSVVIPDIATTGKSGTRSRIRPISSKPLARSRKMSTMAISNAESSNAFDPVAALAAYKRIAAQYHASP
jgi:hypothetical protein